MKGFIGFLLVLFILAAILRIDFFFTILYLMAGVYILSRLWSNRMVDQLAVRRRFQNRAFLGDQIEVTIEVRNRGWLPIPWLMVHETFPVSLSIIPYFREVVSLGRYTRHHFHYHLAARRRGYYQIGPTILQAGDLLGLNQRNIGRIEPDYLIVYPKIKSMAELGLPTHSPQVVLRTPIPIFEDPARVMGVRDYHWGDNPRHIHWTATAGTGQVMVKQFQPAIARDSAIFLNLALSDYERGERGLAVELAIVVAASLANHMISWEKLPVGLHTVAIDPLAGDEQQFRLPPRKEKGQLLLILEILARIKPIERGDFLGSVRQEAVHLSWGATLLLVTNQETDELLETALWLKKSGLNPTLVLIRPHRAGQSSARHEFPTYVVWDEKDVELWSPTP